jgi:LytS/YehU family sensor histidine kinase
MKLEETNSTCTCDSYKNMTIKYGAMLDEYFTTNEMLRKEIVKLQQEIAHLKDYIKYTL